MFFQFFFFASSLKRFSWSCTLNIPLARRHIRWRSTLKKNNAPIAHNVIGRQFGDSYASREARVKHRPFENIRDREIYCIIRCILLFFNNAIGRNQNNITISLLSRLSIREIYDKIGILINRRAPEFRLSSPRQPKYAPNMNIHHRTSWQ